MGEMGTEMVTVVVVGVADRAMGALEGLRGRCLVGGRRGRSNSNRGSRRSLLYPLLLPRLPGVHPPVW